MSVCVCCRWWSAGLVCMFVCVVDGGQRDMCVGWCVCYRWLSAGLVCWLVCVVDGGQRDLYVGLCVL